MISDHDWTRLTNAGTRGVSRRRIHADSTPDLFLAVAYPGGRRMLQLSVTLTAAGEFVRGAAPLPQTHGMELGFAESTPARRELQLELRDDRFQGVFNSLVDDIATTVASRNSDAAALDSFVTRFRYWIRLLDSVRDSGLSQERRRGLYGELTVMRRLLALGLAPLRAVVGWTGPTQTNQDFQVGGGALEVKVTTGRRRSVVIASERQLDSVGLAWLVLVHLYVDERQGGTGSSLNRVVDDLTAELEDFDAQEMLQARLISYGYLPEHRHLYSEPRYSLRKEDWFDVEGAFPRLVESSLPEGVSDCSYRLDTSTLSNWLVDREAVAQRLNPSPQADGST